MSLRPILKFGTKRLLAAIGILLGVTLLCFFVAEGFSPDKRIRRRFGIFLMQIDESEFIEMYNRFGFELGLLEEDGTPIPAIIRYLQWLGLMRDNKGTYNGLLEGKLGISWQYYDSAIEDLIMPKVWFTILLNTIGSIILTATALIVGSIYFAKRNLNSDKHSQKTSRRRIVAMPVLLLSIILIIIFSQVFGFDRLNYDNIIVEPFILTGQFYLYLLLPLLILIIWSITFTWRIISSNDEDILPKKYQTYMNYSGYSQRQKIGKVAKNLSSFLLLYFRNNLSMIYGVLLVIEFIFKLPGIGNLTVVYANIRDIPGLLASIFLYTLVLVIHKYILEMVLVCIDPRILTGEIKLSYASISNRWIHQS